jgi:hypothetical protein
MITGGCLCGAVRYQARSAPITTRVCWCRLCQHLAAGNATVNVVFRSEDVTIDGTLADFVATADSGNILHRGFCPVCGTPVSSRTEIRPHLVILRAGTLDDPEIAQPALTIWTSKAPSWACIATHVPQTDAQPPQAA